MRIQAYTVTNGSVRLPMTVWLRGDHLIRRSGPVARRPDEPVLLIESESFARKLPYHPHKLILLFSRCDMSATISGTTADGPIQQTRPLDGLGSHFEANPDEALVTLRPQATQHRRASNRWSPRQAEPSRSPTTASSGTVPVRRVARRRPLPPRGLLPVHPPGTGVLMAATTR